ncbi:unnamed protein product [Durusdinium trenchii]|uniref:Calmodulin-lysine N-methyltransferase n=1 Tax=Durusdinium trenchii TaxID=1381693 RepID=A0ABP0HSC0_9DINO
MARRPRVEEVCLQDLPKLQPRASREAAADADAGSSPLRHGDGAWRRSLKGFHERFVAQVKLSLRGAVEGIAPVVVSQAAKTSWDSSDPMTTGATLWDAALLLSAYLCTSTRPRLRGSHVLELGSGCGLVGLVAKRLGAEVTLTDLPSLLPLLEANANCNGADVDIRPLLWQEAAQMRWIQNHRFDLVLMSDLLYHEEQFDPLWTVLQVLTAQAKLKRRRGSVGATVSL